MPPILGNSGDNDCSDVVRMNVVTPLLECPHLEQVSEHLPAEGISADKLCSVCHTDQEVWVCLTCFEANCGRYVLGHAESHWMSTRHSMALSLCDLSVWCYACDSYVHNQKLLPAKDSVYLSKFGEGLFDSKKN